MVFADRADAGRQLASRLAGYEGPDARVLALPRGGVPVGYEVARALGAPLDVFVVRKVGAPGREELAIGAIASGGVRVWNRETIEDAHVDKATVEAIAENEQRELERREALYRGGMPAHDVRGKTAIVVDDGLATGASMFAAIVALRSLAPKRIVVAVPVAPGETCEALRKEVEELVCVMEPRPFRSVGAWYADFHQTTDDEVRECLRKANE